MNKKCNRIIEPESKVFKFQRILISLLIRMHFLIKIKIFLNNNITKTKIIQ